MLSTKNLITIDDIPETWIFEYYANLNAKLLGEDITIKSLFKPTEKTPSMKIFNKGGRYFFKDFSTSKGGTAIDLVKALYDIEYGEAVSIIIENYKSYQLKGNKYKKEVLKEPEKTVIDSFKVKQWTVKDAKFWSKYNIGSKDLERYNVKPCEIILKKGNKLIDLSSKMIYAYFTKEGEIYKIYQPYSKDNKFLTFKKYIQGSDQLEYIKPNLVILSSLKDGLSFNSLGLPFEFIAPPSENTILESENMAQLLNRYDKVVVMLDNDESGMRAMLKYNSLYSIEYVNLDLSKDVSDSIKDHGIETTKEELTKLLL